MSWTWDKEKGTIDQGDLQRIDPRKVEQLNDCRDFTEHLRNIVEGQRVVNRFIAYEKGSFWNKSKPKYLHLDCNEFINYKNSINNNGGNVRIVSSSLATRILTEFDHKTNKIIYRLDTTGDYL